MKKWNFFLYTGLLASMCCLFPACTDDKSDDENKGGGEVDPPIEETVLGENTPTPIALAKKMKVDGGSQGVSIEVSEVKNETFVFNLKPGKNIQSYKLDVFPLPMLYNYMFELSKSFPDKVAEDMIYDSMFATDGSGAYSFGINELGENWDHFEINWAESKYRQFDIAPGVTYIIAAVGCFDDQASEPAEMTLCYVTTTNDELIGAPKVYIETGSGFKSGWAEFEPNPDTYYFYQFCSPSKEIDEFIENYSQDMFEDLMRTWFQAPMDAKDEELEKLMGWSFPNPDPTMAFSATAIALDMNKTKGEFSRDEFYLKEIPSDATPADKYTIGNFRASARKVEFEATADITCSVIFYQTLPKSSWDAIKDDPKSMASLKESLDAGGWAIDNRESFDKDIQTNVIKKYDYLLTPDTEYVIVSIARNRFLQLTDPVASESFRTKPLVYDAPEESLSKVNIKLSDPTRTSFNANYQFNDQTALYFHQLVLDKTKIDDFVSGRDKSRLINWLGMIGTDQSNSANWVSVWTPESIDQTNDQWNWTGMDPAQKYYYAIIGEDWNGVLSEISIDSISTESIQAGPDPQMKIQSLITDNNEWFVNFAIEKDVAHYRYMILDDIYSTDPDYTYEECLEIWEEKLIGEEGFDYVNSVSISVNIKKGQRMVALCTPYGAEEVKGDMIFQVFDPSLNEDYTKCIVPQEKVKETFFGTRSLSAVKRSIVAYSVEMFTPGVIVKERLSAKDVPSKMPVINQTTQDELIYFGVRQSAKYPKFISK